MALTLCVLLMIVVLERYANRTDTKSVIETRKKGGAANDAKGPDEMFFSAE